jgi:hypothetical protein
MSFASFFFFTFSVFKISRGWKCLAWSSPAAPAWGARSARSSAARAWSVALGFRYTNHDRVERDVVLYAAGLDSERLCHFSASLPEQISNLFLSTFIKAIITYMSETKCPESHNCIRYQPLLPLKSHRANSRIHFEPKAFIGNKLP